MRAHLERLLERLDERGRGWALLGLPIEILLAETERLPPEPAYGLTAADHDVIATAFGERHDALWALSCDELIAHDCFEEISLDLPNGLRAIVEVVVDAYDDGVGVGMSAALDEQFGGGWIAEGPAFFVGRDGSREPDDGLWPGGLAPSASPPTTTS